MEKYKVLISGINTSDLVTLSVQEMKGLFERYKAGDLFARDLLIEGNLRLVLSILKKFYNHLHILFYIFLIFADLF